MTTIAIYPGTFDPITNGHFNLIQRAAKMFDRIIVAVASSTRKTPYFDLSTRLQMAKESLASIQSVEVVALEGLLVNFAKQYRATIILRGLRAVSDFDYEFQLAAMNRELAHDIETVFLPATQSNAFVSATLLREILSLGGDVRAFVPNAVMKYLQART